MRNLRGVGNAAGQCKAPLLPQPPPARLRRGRDVGHVFEQVGLTGKQVYRFHPPPVTHPGSASNGAICLASNPILNGLKVWLG
jgi:hypothetical protein